MSIRAAGVVGVCAIIAALAQSAGSDRDASEDAPATTAPAPPTAAVTAPTSTAVAPATTVAPDTTAEPGPDDVLCRRLAALADTVAASGRLDLTLPWRRLQPRLLDALEEAGRRYDAILAVAPRRIARAVEVLAAYTDAQAREARAASSRAAFESSVGPPGDRVRAAGETLDGDMRERCGRGLTSG